MSTQHSPRAVESLDWLQRTQSRVFWFAIVGLYVVAVIAPDSAIPFASSMHGVAFALLIGAAASAAALLHAWHQAAAAATLVCGCLATSLLMATWGGLEQSIGLLTLSSGLALLTLGLLPGVDRIDAARVVYWRDDFADLSLGELMNRLAE